MATGFAVKVVAIKEILVHPNADKLDLAVIDGWQCVVQKGSYKAGDLAVYIPIDSILPAKVETALFGPDSKIKLSKSRVRTIKLRGAISQGMLAPCEDLGVPKKLGYDCTKDLEISKYEPPEVPAHMSGGMPVKKLKKNPLFKEYGGLDNFKHYPELFQEGELVVITEKIHGTNFRCGWLETAADTWWKRALKFVGLLPKYEFVYGSNKVQLQNKMLYKGYYGKNVYAEAVKNLDLKERLEPFRGYVLYGEIYGDGIQENYGYGCQPDEQKFIAFDLMVDGKYVDHDSMEAFVLLKLRLETAPVLYYGPYSFAEAKKLTLGNSVLAPNQKVREGVVIRPIKETVAHMGRKVLKLISEEYDLKKDNSDFH